MDTFNIMKVLEVRSKFFDHTLYQTVRMFGNTFMVCIMTIIYDFPKQPLNKILRNEICNKTTCLF